MCGIPGDVDSKPAVHCMQRFRQSPSAAIVACRRFFVGAYGSEIRRQRAYGWRVFMKCLFVIRRR